MIGAFVFPATASAANGLSREAAWSALTPALWRADLQYLADTAPKTHKALFHTMAPAAFSAAVADLDAAIPNLSPDQILVRFLRLGAMIQDSHSGVALADIALPEAPIRFAEFDDGVFVLAADPAHAHLVGGKLVALGGVGWKEALARAYALTPHDPDNPGQQRTWAARTYLNVPMNLHGLGLSDSPDHARFTVAKDGREENVTLDASYNPGEFSLDDFVTDAPPPGWAALHPPGLADSHPGRYFWFQPVGEALYVDVRATVDEPHLSVVDFSQQLIDALKTRPPQRIVLDLRRNPGGDNTLLKPLLLALIRSDANHRGGLWVLTSGKTHSAAQNFLNRLENLGDLVLVGQPTGQNVNFYGDPKEIELPNSHIPIALSALYWQDKDPRDHRAATDPEIAAPASFADYAAGRDPTLEIALHDPAPETLETIAERAAPGGATAVTAAYRIYVEDPRHRYIANGESRMNRAGYLLLGQKKTSDAVAVFQANAETHPHSVNAYDSLGEGLEAVGDNSDALKAYVRAAALDPASAHEAEAVKRLSTSR